VHSNVEPKLDIEQHIPILYVAHVNLKIKHTQRFFLGDLELLFQTCLSKVLAYLEALLYPYALPILWIYESLVLVRRFAIIFSYVCHGTLKPLSFTN
jgi:ABC-type molybdate transport system ATPase subunit